MGPIGPIPATESQARELGRIKDPEERIRVWAKITETHEPEEITAKVIREVVEESQTIQVAARVIDTDPENKEGYIHTETHEVSDAMTFAGMAICQLEYIRHNDPHRVDALEKVAEWIVKEGVRLSLSRPQQSRISEMLAR